MTRETLMEHLKKKLKLEVYVAQTIEDKSNIPMLLDIIENDKSAIKFICEKIIREISKESPEDIYPYFDRIAKLLDSGNAFIKLGFMLTLPNLLSVDNENKWEGIKGKYLSLIDAEAIAIFGNAVSSIWKILDKYPEDEKYIIPKLLNIDEHTFLYKGEASPECLNVAKGHIIECFDRIFPNSKYKDEMIEFVRANKDNSRNSVRVKAQRFLKKYAE